MFGVAGEAPNAETLNVSPTEVENGIEFTIDELTTRSTCPFPILTATSLHCVVDAAGEMETSAAKSVTKEAHFCLHLW